MQLLPFATAKTKNLKEITAKADILIAAIGKPEFVDAEMVKKGAIIIDVGIHRKEILQEKKAIAL